MAEIVPNKVPCSKKPEPTPKPEPIPVTLCDLTGVKYFKLHSDIPGDYTKNCGLLGNEIDENFYFLRSMDIKTGYTIEEEGRKYLILERVNCGKEIKIDITDEDVYDHGFRVDDGYIFVKYPDGHEDPIRDGDGNPVRFLVEGDNVRVVTDATIVGDGRYENPLSLDLAYRTGTYAPADFYADLTCPEVTINDVASGIGYGHAVVTKENVSRFGALYTFWEAKKLNEDLNKRYGEHGWRVPSKEDWAKLLNWAEEKDEDRNHDTDRSGNFGCVAGSRLKSTLLWDGNPNRDDIGFSVYPVGICPEDYNTEEPSQYDFTGLHKVSSFWSSTEKDDEAYVRTFSYGHDDVAQYTESPARRLSIRLVRDITEDFDIAGYADILGNFVPTVLTTDGKQLWTLYNIDITNYKDCDENGVTFPEAWKDVDTDIPAVAYYEKVISGDCFVYVPIEEYEIPTSETPVEVEEVPENPTEEDPLVVYISYTIHLDMVTEAKFFYNAMGQDGWHKKVMREGESVVIIGEDFETGCDTAATPYVTSANTNHEWRIFVNEQTGLDELIDTLEALKGEFQKELDEINERIDDLSATTEEFSAATVEEIARLDERISGLTIAEVTPTDETILKSYQLFEGDIPKGVTIDIPKDDVQAFYEVKVGHSGATIDPVTGDITDGPYTDHEVLLISYLNSEGVYKLVEVDLENLIVEDEFASGVTADKETHIVHGVVDPESEDFLTVGGDGFKLSGVQDAIDAAARELWEALSAETAERIAADEELWNALSAETAARTEADEYLQEQIDELKAKAIDPADDSIVIEVSGSSTTIRVQISETEDHLKLSDGTVVDYVDAAGHEILIPKGLYIDQDFGEFGE